MVQVANSEQCVPSSICAGIDWVKGIDAITSSANLDLVLNGTTLTLRSSLQLDNVDSNDTGSYTCGLRILDTIVAGRSLAFTVHGKLLKSVLFNALLILLSTSDLGRL